MEGQKYSLRIPCLDRKVEINETRQQTSQQSPPSPVSDVETHISAHPIPTHFSPKPQKMKREAEQSLKWPSPKRARASRSGLSIQDVDSIASWTQTHQWPQDYFSGSRKTNNSLEKKEPTAALPRKRSHSESNSPSLMTPNDQKPGEEKSTPHQDPPHTSLLEAKESLVGKCVGGNEDGPTAESKAECDSLVEIKQAVPERFFLQDDFFEENYQMIQDRNEAKVIQDIARLVLPSA